MVPTAVGLPLLTLATWAERGHLLPESSSCRTGSDRPNCLIPISETFSVTLPGLGHTNHIRDGFTGQQEESWDAIINMPHIRTFLSTACMTYSLCTWLVVAGSRRLKQCVMGDTIQVCVSTRALLCAQPRNRLMVHFSGCVLITKLHATVLVKGVDAGKAKAQPNQIMNSSYCPVDQLLCTANIAHGRILMAPPT